MLSLQPVVYYHNDCQDPTDQGDKAKEVGIRGFTKSRAQ